MNCVDYAINEIVNGGDIPTYLLKLAFEKPNGNYIDNYYSMVNQNTVEQGIRDKVIHQIVLSRCKIQGGILEFIDLTGANVTDLGQSNVMVQVPDFLTGGRKIISMVEVYQGAMNSTTGVLGVMGSPTSCGVGTVNEVTGGLIESLRGPSRIPQTYTRIQPLGNNTFVINGVPRGVFSMTAKCILESDDALSYIAAQAIPYFSILCQHAVKAYIYKECRFPTGDAVERYGVTVDAISDVIGSYSDAWNNYLEYFDEKWLQYMNYSDRIRKATAIKMGVGGRF